jgi:hypothetical protein
LRELVTVLRERINPELDEYASERFVKMLSRYPGQLGISPDAPVSAGPASVRPTIFSRLHDTDDD